MAKTATKKETKTEATTPQAAAPQQAASPPSGRSGESPRQDAPADVAALAAKVDAQAKQIERLAAVVEKATGGAVKEVRIELPEPGPAHVGFYRWWQIEFKGPDADKFVQPAEVKAICASDAVAAVVKSCRLEAHRHRFNATPVGARFVVQAKNKGAGGEHFPMESRATSAEAAIEAARRVTGTKAELVAEEV